MKYQLGKKLKRYLYDASTDGIIRNRKLVTEFAYHVREMPLDKIHEGIPSFKEEPYYKEKSYHTRRNYLTDLKKFCRYVYLREGVDVPDCVRLHEKLSQPRREYTSSRLNVAVVEHSVPMAEPVVSDEYYEFLRRYEELDKEE